MFLPDNNLTIADYGSPWLGNHHLSFTFFVDENYACVGKKEAWIQIVNKDEDIDLRDITEVLDMFMISFLCSKNFVVRIFSSQNYYRDIRDMNDVKDILIKKDDNGALSWYQNMIPMSNNEIKRDILNNTFGSSTKGYLCDAIVDGAYILKQRSVPILESCHPYDTTTNRDTYKAYCYLTRRLMIPFVTVTICNSTQQILVESFNPEDFTIKRVRLISGQDINQTAKIIKEML